MPLTMGILTGNMLMPVTMALTDSQGTGSNPPATIDFGAQAIGVAAANRLVVVVFQHADSNNRYFTSMSIGGVGATTNKYQKTSSGWYGVAVSSRVVPAGTTTTVSVSCTSSVNQAAIAVYAINQVDLLPIVLKASCGSVTPAVPATINFSALGSVLIGGVNQTGSNSIVASFVGWTRNTRSLHLSNNGQYCAGSNRTATSAAHQISVSNCPSGSPMAACVYGV